MTLSEIKIATYNRMRLIRRLDYIVNESTSFSVAWENATEQERKTLESLVNDINVEGLHKFIKEIMATELENKSVDVLRKIAIRYGFSGLSRHAKSELLYLINGAQKNEESGSSK